MATVKILLVEVEDRIHVSGTTTAHLIDVNCETKLFMF